MKNGDDHAPRDDVSERRWRTLVEGIPQLVWRSNNGGDWTWASPQWMLFTGQTLEASLGAGWLDAVHPEDRRTAQKTWRRARLRHMFEVQYRVRHAPSDTWRWCHTRALPVLGDTPGDILEWLGTSTDIDDLRTAHLEQQRLTHELQHRVRNSMAVIRSITRRTALLAESVEDMAAHLYGRIDAFARVQAMVTRGDSDGIDLYEIISDELLVHAMQDGEQVSLTGPVVLVRPKTAELIALAMHEMLTNAVKFGVLGIAGGTIAVRWEVGPVEFRLYWVERGAPPPPPRRDGFGTELLERTLPYELNAQTKRDFRSDGIDIEIMLPVADNLIRVMAA
jgi:PAS domain S-box-containing protein